MSTNVFSLVAFLHKPCTNSLLCPLLLTKLNPESMSSLNLAREF